MEADTEPWEVLDLDDSELPSLILPSKRKSPSPRKSFSRAPPLERCSTLSRRGLTPNQPPQPPSLIPGPAGAVQAAMFRRSQNRESLLSVGGEPIPTQEYIRRAVEEPGCEDDDFSRDPWLFAVDYVRRKGLVDGDGVAIGTPLSLIGNGSVKGKVAQIIAIVKSLAANGHGDVMVTLKDPTGTIDGSIHKRVFTESEFGKQISIGSVLLLQKVAVFSPSRTTFYLNITLGNLVKAFSNGCKDLEPIDPVSTSQLLLPSVEKSKVPTTRQVAFSLSERGNEGIIDNPRQSADMRGSMRDDKELEGLVRAASSLCRAGSNQNKNQLVEKALQSVSQKVVEGLKRAGSEVSHKDHTEQVLMCNQHSQQNEEDEGCQQGRTCSRNVGVVLVELHDNPENENTEGPKKKTQSLASKGTLPHWTDEQLDELLAFD